MEGVPLQPVLAEGGKWVRKAERMKENDCPEEMFKRYGLKD